MGDILLVTSYLIDFVLVVLMVAPHVGTWIEEYVNFDHHAAYKLNAEFQTIATAAH